MIDEKCDAAEHEIALNRGKHPSHETRFSWDASTYDFVCMKCGATDQVPGGWGALSELCPVINESK